MEGILRRRERVLRTSSIFSWGKIETPSLYIDLKLDFELVLQMFAPSEKLRFSMTPRTLKKNQRFQSSLDWIIAFRESVHQEPQCVLSEGVVRSTFPLSWNLGSGGTFRWFLYLSKSRNFSSKNQNFWILSNVFLGVPWVKNL